MADHRAVPRKAALCAVCLAGLVAGLALWAAPGRPAQAAASAESAVLPDSLAFEVRYGGIGAEGVDLVWRARAGARWMRWSPSGWSTRVIRLIAGCPSGR